MDDDRTLPPPSHPAFDGPTLVVGVGASAGGIKALKEFFAQVQPNSGAAFAVILHLSPAHDSKLAEVLQVTSPIAVTQVTARVRLEANHVYVIPPNKTLEVTDHHLDVSEFTGSEQRRAPVDIFFRALADSHGARAAAVVLSGTGPDGSAGLKRIKEHGGLTIAQDPAEAEYGDMPRNAIATGLVDFVLPVGDMFARIHAYHERVRQDGFATGGAEAAAVRIDAEALRDVLSVLRVRTGHDFTNYKPSTLQRRIQRRLYVRGLPTLASYARAMREHPDESVALMKELLISVTNFFRDPAAFHLLAGNILPRILADKDSQDQVRVWVPGCATGEEAYSIAMLLVEHGAGSMEQPVPQVFATDLDEQAIATAREGYYTDPEVADVSEQRLQRFFHREAGGYRVKRELREAVLFAHHNVITDPPFSHLDLISCRNLLIYFNRTIQDRVIETFHFALRPGRYLFLGSSESPESPNDLFVAVDKNARIYESRGVATRLAVPLGPGLPRPLPKPANARWPERISPAELHHRILEQYAPPSLIVTEDHHVVHMSERVGRYLHIMGGEPTRELMRLILPELRADVRTALYEAGRQLSTVSVRGVRVPLEDGERAVDVSVKPVLREGDPLRGYFLITFEEGDAAAAVDSAVQLSIATEPATPRLEEELARVRGQLRTTIEQYETQVEEAKAANEELHAMNEELRSSAEELETSQEELQSVNEELTTVNQELKIKIEELGLANSDFQNLINAIDVGTIFLDRHLRVKLSTPAARSIFNVVHTDIGRPLADITDHILDQGLHEDVRQVLEHLRTIEREVGTRDGRWHLLRMRPYRTTDDRIDGVVITFQDITHRTNAERQVRESEERLRLLVDSTIDYAIFTFDSRGTVDSWNSGAERMFGYAAGEIVGRNVEILFTPEDRKAGVPAKELETAARDGRASDERYHLRKNGDRFYCSGVTTRLAPGAPGFAKIARDLTEQRMASDALKQAHDRLDEHVQERTRALQTEVIERTAAQQEATNLVRKLVTSQEDERARIARDLHDQLGQQLTALRLSLERVAHQSGDEQLTRVLGLAERIDDELGFLAWELRPAVLDDLGLAAALPRFVKEWSDHYGIAAECRSTALPARTLPHEAEIAFYRIAQEALNNVSKHAHASRVDVMLESRDGYVVMVVEDDGVGFDPTSREVKDRGIGLTGMSERAGLAGATFAIESAPGKGTSIFLRCPTR